MSIKRCLLGSFLGFAALLVLALSPASTKAASPVVASKYAALVMDRETGEVFFARNADVHRYPASLTKMMTLYMVFEAIEKRQIRMDGYFTVSRRAAGQPPSKLGLRAGSKIKVKDAVMALITKSANDVATTIAENLGTTEWQFARMMTAKAKELGMKRTRFRNASGLPHSGQVSTARDMAMLGKALIENYPNYFELFDTERFRYQGRTYKNHNRLLGSYKGTNGIKTGYIRAAGFNLVSSVERDGRNLIGVVFGGRTSRLRDRHMISILDKSFKRAGPSKERFIAMVPKQRPSTLLVASADTSAAQVEAGSIDPDQELKAQESAPDTDLIAEIIEATSNPVTPTSITAAADNLILPQPRAAQKDASPATAAAAAPPAKAKSEKTAKPPVVVAANTVQPSLTDTKQAPNLRLPEEDWAIQVGAFSNAHPATRAVDQAQRLMPILLASSIPSIEKAETKKPLYRARLRNLSEEAARDACVRLKARRIGCVPVAPEPGVKVAQRN